VSDEKIEVRLRSTPTRFSGRHSIVGFIPDGEFISKTITVEQFEELKANRDLIVELGAAPKNLTATEKAISSAADALKAEKRAHADTKEQLGKLRAEHAALSAAHGRITGELAALKNLASGS
jgi:hypothetical protein